jgi:hypothetical protein
VTELHSPVSVCSPSNLFDCTLIWKREYTI